jgi:hypothetical protein
VAFKRVSFPPVPQEKLKNGSPLHLLSVIDRYLAGDVHTEFDRRAEQIRERQESGHLGPAGVQEEMRKLRNDFELRLTTRPFLADAAESWGQFLDRAKKRVGELEARLTSRTELPADMPEHLKMRAVLQADRVVGEHLKLEPAARRRVEYAALDKLAKGDQTARNFLVDLREHPGVLDSQTAALIDDALMRTADPAAYQELELFLGPVDPTSGKRDPIGGALRVVEYNLQLFREHMDRAAGLDAVTEQGRAVFQKQLEIAGAPITLTAEEGRDPRLYRLARDMAAQNGRVLSITGDEGGEIVPPAPAPEGGANGRGE